MHIHSMDNNRVKEDFILFLILIYISVFFFNLAHENVCSQGKDVYMEINIRSKKIIIYIFRNVLIVFNLDNDCCKQKDD